VEGYLNLILDGQVADKPEKQHNMLERSLLRINTLRNMVSELMNLTAMETGKFTIRRSQLDLGQVLTEAIDSCRERAEKNHTLLSVTGEEFSGLEHVLADRDAMFIVFRNLIDNAIKYSPEKGNVTVHVEQNGIYIKVKVKDTGIGMTPEEKGRVFEEFFRAKNTFTANVPGTGLGLSLVKRLVDMHNGTISVESTVGEGTEFTVCVPIEG
jgi:signal transduction histidine kinase